MKKINEEGEPTNSVSAGSTDHHEPTDGKKKKEKTKITRRKKMTKYQEYKESLKEDHSENYGWSVYNVSDLTSVIKNIKNLDIPPTDYAIHPDQGTVEFKYSDDMEAVEALDYDKDPHGIKPHKPYKDGHDEEDEIRTTYYNDATGGI